MWNPQNFAEFHQIVQDLMEQPQILALREMDQHSKTSNRLDHSIYVAYLSFLFCRRMGYNYVAAARAGLLHDFHFAGDADGMKRLWKHPHRALENAKKLAPLSAMEQDIIVKHMWPLTRPLPRHKETLVVSMADKLCALLEMSRLYKLLRVEKHLVPLAA